ncbi:MAG TPA: amidohydrolase family protein [Burkholderiales bacterium]|nr:amidohydrolase family protein [Burkholderiales bacterium]
MNPKLKLDIFPHIFPKAFFERVKGIAEQNPALAAQIKRWLHIPVLWDLEARLRMMDRFKGYKQILTLSLPAIEFLAPPDQSPELARLANDGMAEIVAKHPDYFPAFVASLPMNNVPETLKEMDRAIGELGAKGIQIFTNMNGRPLDDPEFYPIFERMANKYDLPVWVHPTRTAKFVDYPGEAKSKYEIYWLFGWPYETSAFMARLVFSGMMEKLPKLKIITHHLGAMAPFFDARIGYGMDQLGTRTSDEDYTVILKRMAKRPVDYFKMFYADTSVNGSKSATRCGLDFFGADHVLFGTDCPFDPEGGPLFIREIIKTIASLKLKDGDQRKVYFGNAIRLLKLELPAAPKATAKSSGSKSKSGKAKSAKSKKGTKRK